MFTSGRQYEEAWCTLRDKGTVEIVAQNGFHKRIVKGIRKERYRDTAHQVFLDQLNEREVMTYTSERVTLTIKLERKPRINFNSLFKG